MNNGPVDGPVDVPTSEQILADHDGVLRIRINHSYAGFFAYVTFALNQLLYCERNRLLPVVDFGPWSGDGPNAYHEDARGPNTWEYWFEPVAGLGVADLAERLADPADPLAEDHVRELSVDELWHLHAYEPASVFNYPYGIHRDVPLGELPAWYADQRTRARELIGRYVRLRPEVVDQVDAFVARHFGDAAVIGAHLRGSDKGAADGRPELMRIVEPDEYAPYIDSFLRQRPDAKVFVATEQSQFVDAVRDRYGERVVSASVSRVADFGEDAVPFQREDGSAAGRGDEVLLDCLLLSRCDFLLKCTSGVGEYALYFNDRLECVDLNVAPSLRGPSHQAATSTPRGSTAAAVSSAPPAPAPPIPDGGPTGRDFQDLIGPGRLFEGCVLINLDDRPDRLERSVAELAAWNLAGGVTRLRAVTHEQPMFGCSVSHVLAVRLAKWHGWRSVLILEDDIRVVDDFGTHAPAALRDLAQREWGLFQFGAMFYHGVDDLEFVTPHLFRFRHAQAAHAFALHERTYDFLLDDYVCEPDRGNFDWEDHYPFDEYVNNVLTWEYEAYGSTRLLVSQHAGFSDTWQTPVDYADGIEHQYDAILALQRERDPGPSRSRS